MDNPELDRLEVIADRFNLFEVIGFTRQELRHSAFLAYLLDPTQNHQLGDILARRFLERVLASANLSGQAVSPIHVNSWDFTHLTVRREWNHIDILMVDSRNRFVVIIENKIDTGEHSDQLARYLQHVQDEYPEPEWRRLAILLSPDDTEPSEDSYLPVAYRTVVDVVESVAEGRRAALDPAVHIMMTHYASMLRRHIVADSEIADLCRHINARHRRALDLIFEHRPDHLSDISAILLALIASNSDLILDRSGKQQIRFGVKAWESLPRGTGWTPSGRMLLFEFDNTANSLDLGLWVGPGPLDVRQRFIVEARKPLSPFRLVKNNPETAKWTSIFRRNILKEEDYDSMTSEAFEQHIRKQWAQFVAADLPVLVNAMKPEVVGFTEPAVNG